MKRILVAIAIIAALLVVGGCTASKPTASPTQTKAATPTATPHATPTSIPNPTVATATATRPLLTETPTESVTTSGRVVDVELSARVILLKTDKGVVLPLALVEGADIFGPNGNEIPLRNVSIGNTVTAKGRRGSNGLLVSEVHVLPPKTKLSDWRIVVGKGDGSVWLVSTKSGPVKQLLPPPADKSFSGYLWSVSPDKKMMAYVRYVDWREDDASASLEIMDLKTLQKKVILPHLLKPGVSWKTLPDDADRAAMVENTPVWNHAGTAFAFISAHEGKANLYLYDLKSGEVRLLASPPYNAAWPKWSPDDHWIIFSDIQAFGVGAGPTGGALWSVSADGKTKARRLSPNEKLFEYVFAWISKRHVLTAFVSIAGNASPTVVNIASGERITPIETGELLRSSYVLSAGAPGKPSASFWTVNSTSSSFWRLPKPIIIENALEFHGKYLPYRGHDGKCYVYRVAERKSVESPEVWCEGDISPTGEYVVKNTGNLLVKKPDDHLEISSTKSGTKVNAYLSDVPTTKWAPDGSVLLAVRYRGHMKKDLFGIDPKSGEVSLIMRDLDYMPGKFPVSFLHRVP